ncbi:sugar phosphate isomerase/epimerase family protein [Paenibacillus sacheonensis]|uniref:TIM barrel protein n=1 Tax=Paenibacillus sacheonensis TaxID=742054 RepID=A0A7X5C124_9BACL|nr:sugar phosphate isomerase/epimerase [Paenibacillus sacheonensis]MBM7568506.1 sugar phosphate isomerase/epimerase [Paenibacillus sacheonensis]NBC72332.1 TIM barrel protein [Paenibacillus sacheonensis]
MNMKLGMRIPPKIGAQGMEKTAELAAAAGLDVLDLPRLTPEWKVACEGAGLGIGSVDVGHTAQLLSRDEARRADAAEAAKREMSEIAALGSRVLFMCLVPEDRTLPRSEGFAIWKETFPAIVKHAEREGLYIAIEGWPGPAPHYPTLGCTPEMLRAMFDAIPSKHFGWNYDPSHLVRLGIDYIRALGEFGERINHCHGKDTEILHDELYECGVLEETFGAKYGFSEGSWRYTIPGHGEVDWGKVAVRLDRLGYSGAVSIELEDHRFWGSLAAESRGIEKAVMHLAKYFK